MDAYLLYTAKLAICLAIFYLFVKALLSNETFFNINRHVLLIGMALCIAIPIVKLTTPQAHAIQSPFVEMESFIIVNSAGDAQATLSNNQPDEQSSLNWISIVFAIYIIGVVVNLSLLLRSVFAMLRLIRKGEKKAHSHLPYSVVITEEDVCPFSWKNYIVLSRSDYENNPDEILTHEIAHIQNRHWLDTIYMELILLVQWFNPAAWLLRSELRDIHEYQADMSVLKTGIDATKYQLLLVKKAVGASSYTLANSFNHSKIKKRITMMLKERSTNWARLKLLLLLPLGTLTVYALAHPEGSVSKTETSSAKVTQLASKNNAEDLKSYGLQNPKKKDSASKTKAEIDRSIIELEFQKEKEMYESPDRIGTPSEGKFKVMFMKNMKTNVSTVQPTSYNRKDNGVESDYIRIYWYVIDGKKYSRSKFEDKCYGGRVFFEKDKIRPEDGTNIIEVHGITDDGRKTPVFYMAMP